MIKMIVFDMAGTTVNEHNIVYKTVQEAVNAAGFDFSLETVLAYAAGKEKLQAIKSVLGSAGVVDDDLAERIFADFTARLEKAYKTKTITEQPNATKLFHALKEKGIAVALNTGYNRETAEFLITRIGWQQGKDFDSLVTASDVKHGRPLPDMIRLAMQQMNIDSAAHVVKVGDSIIDVEEGKNAGCGITVGITTGAHTFEQLQSASPSCIINDLEELAAVVEKLNVK
ncbi:MAG: phosphonatase-like hydrolase [Chitinophagaceae bacterium]